MCLIIYRPSSQKVVTKDMLDNSCQHGNDDSFGLMWTEHDGKLHTWRGMKNEYDTLLYNVEHLNRSTFPFAVHGRFATHGTVNMDNCHPFEPIPGKVGFMHNGILSNWTPSKKDSPFSDTALLAETLRNFPRRWWLNRALRYTLGEAIGYGNKLCIMDSTGRTFMINEEQGQWHAGLWFSNDTYKGWSNHAAKRLASQYAQDDGEPWESRYTSKSGLPTVTGSSKDTPPLKTALGAALRKMNLTATAQDRECVGAIMTDGAPICTSCIDDLVIGGFKVGSLAWAEDAEANGLVCEGCGEHMVTEVEAVIEPFEDDEPPMGEDMYSPGTLAELREINAEIEAELVEGRTYARI